MGGHSRIIGQCNQADFAEIEHLVDSIINPEDLDTSTLKRKQIFAFLFTNEARRKGISWKLLRSVVQEVLFWGEGDYVRDIEIKFMRDARKHNEILEFRRLWSS